jgi:hypothetical protein
MGEIQRSDSLRGVKMEWNDWIGKRIFVKLIDGAVYSGVVLDVENSRLIKIRDKFGEVVIFLTSNIAKLKEENFQNEN